jgi:hypothetical protein
MVCFSVRIVRTCSSRPGHSVLHRHCNNDCTDSITTYVWIRLPRVILGFILAAASCPRKLASAGLLHPSHGSNVACHINKFVFDSQWVQFRQRPICRSRSFYCSPLLSQWLLAIGRATPPKHHPRAHALLEMRLASLQKSSSSVLDYLHVVLLYKIRHSRSGPHMDVKQLTRRCLDRSKGRVSAVILAPVLSR